MKRLLAGLLGAAAVLALTVGSPSTAAAQGACTIALIPGLTTDAFYITMRKGAEMAAKAVGCELIFQGAPDFNPVTQVPVLQAVIARKPGAILIAPTDKQQLIAPLQQAFDAGIPVITVDTFIDDGKYQDGNGTGDYPLSYIATDNVLGGFLGGVALAKSIGERGKVYVSNVKPGISTTDQREEGFKLAMRAFPTSPCSTPSSTTTTPTRPRPRSRRCSPATPTSPACSAPTCSPRWVRPTASRRWASRVP